MLGPLARRKRIHAGSRRRGPPRLALRAFAASPYTPDALQGSNGPYDIIIPGGRTVDGTGSAWSRVEVPIVNHATFTEPHRLFEGACHVFVHGAQVVQVGDSSRAKAGRIVRGPGWTG